MPIYESYKPSPVSAHHKYAPIVLRDEQKEAVKLAKAHFKAKGFRQFLWNAKMRFGKTLSALQLAKEMGVHRTLIVTHRPVVETNFREDFEKIFKDERDKWDYATRFDEEESGSLDSLEKMLAAHPDRHYVFFASMQYLRRSSLVNTNPGADNDPLKRQILENDWDLVVVDEAHEGTRTSLGKHVIDTLHKSATKMLHLSGTPFNLYCDFNDNEIYTWDYIMEQRAKRNWKPDGMFQTDDDNPYLTLPEMKILTYDLAKLRGSEAVKQGDSFTLSEFFRTWKKKSDGSLPAGMPADGLGKFVHEEAVRNFLDLLCAEDGNNYPFSTDEYRENFKHTLWVVPGVKEAKALSKLLHEHEVFSQFKVINVAGDGDDDEQREDALQGVLKAIGKAPDQTYTITISCGRLTTGVTVPPWTAVFYLKGADTTGPATYMQTIFRVQSSHVYNGQMKAQCYVFDFAPDRSLRAVAEAARFAAKARKQKITEGDESEEKKNLEDFLSFCPVISLDGGQMVNFNVDTLFEQINHVYNDRIARNGFNDNALYDVNYILDTMTDGDIKDLNAMGVEIGKSTNMEKPPKAKDISKNGLTPAQRKAGAEAGKKSEKERTPEEQAAYEALKKEREERRKEKENRIKILRGISLRIPLLIFGGRFNDDDDDEITLDNFTRKVDDASWAEFMPAGVTKEKFNRFKRCYNVARFEGAGRLYRQWTREADSMHMEERIDAVTKIHEMFHNPDKETVLTPWRVVNMHLSDCLGGYCFKNEDFSGPVQREVFEHNGKLIDYVDTIQPRFVDRGDVTASVFNAGEPSDRDTSGGTRILEINSKTGLYPLYAAYSIYRRRKDDFIAAGLIANPEDLTVEEEQVIWDDVLRDNIYVISNTPMAEAITRRTLYGFRQVKHTHIKNDQIVKRAKTEPDALAAQLRRAGYWNGTTSKAMLKFTAVIGNPPYQESISSEATVNNDAFGTAMYPKFISLAQQLEPNYVSLITPSRWMTRTGQGINLKWVDEMLSNNHFVYMKDFIESQECFTSVEIKGGVNYFLLNPAFSGDCQYNLKTKNALVSRLGKLDHLGIGLVLRDAMAIDIIAKIENQEGRYYEDKNFSSYVGPKHFFDTDELLGSNWTGYSKSETEVFNVKFYVNKNLETCGYGWVSKAQIPRGLEALNIHKVFIPESGGSGKDEKILGNPFYGEPNSVCSYTYLIIGYDSVSHKLTKESAENIIKYISTRFFRYLVSIKKKTQHNTRAVFQFVPLQDFTSESDIDWSKDVAEIDRQLYAKYGLDEEEIAFIERMIKPM